MIFLLRLVFLITVGKLKEKCSLLLMVPLSEIDFSVNKFEYLTKFRRFSINRFISISTGMCVMRISVCSE